MVIDLIWPSDSQVKDETQETQPRTYSRTSTIYYNHEVFFLPRVSSMFGFECDFLSERFARGGFGQILCVHNLSSNTRDSKFGENSVKPMRP
jgi:hypothetical protein